MSRSDDVRVVVRKWEAEFCDCDGAVDAPKICDIHHVVKVDPAGDVTTAIDVLVERIKEHTRPSKVRLDSVDADAALDMGVEDATEWGDEPFGNR